MSACPGTGAGWGSPPETWSTISRPGWVTPMCRSTKARRSSATWRRRDMPEPMGFFTDTTVCNGCRACIAACPFGVIDVNPVSGTAQKCTLCYDRLKVGLEPACSKACPTDSIQFGSIVELRTRAQKRVDQLKAQGVKAELYGADPDGALGGLNSFYLLVDEPEVYGLPRKPTLPSRNLAKSAGFSVASAAVLGVLALVGLRKGRMDDMGGPGAGGAN